MNKQASLSTNTERSIAYNKKYNPVWGVGIFIEKNEMDIFFTDHCLIVNHEVVHYKFQPIEHQLHNQ